MRRMSLLLLVVFGVGMGFGSGGTFAQTHPFSIHDMLAMDRISDPQVSPDGKTVVFVVRRTDLEANRGRNRFISGGNGRVKPAAFDDRSGG